MKITRDVILDLLPLYDSGEASADTRALVEEYLRQDPDLARMARQQAPAMDELPAEPPPDLYKKSLERTKKMIRLRSRLMTLAVCFTWVSLFVLVWDIKWGGRTLRGTFVMWRDQPVVAFVSLVAAIVCWVMWYRVRRRLRATGL